LQKIINLRFFYSFKILENNTTINTNIENTGAKVKKRSPNYLFLSFILSTIISIFSLTIVTIVIGVSKSNMVVSNTFVGIGCDIEYYSICGKDCWYYPEIYASYIFDHNNYTSNNTLGLLSFTNTRFLTYESINTTMLEYIGTHRICFVDPNEPTHFLLDKSINPVIIVSIVCYAVICSIFTLISIILLILRAHFGDTG